MFSYHFFPVEVTSGKEHFRGGGQQMGIMLHRKKDRRKDDEKKGEASLIHQRGGETGKEKQRRMHQWN